MEAKINRIMMRAAVLICAAAVAVACLDEDTSSIVSPAGFFRSQEQCQAAVNGVYIPLKSIYNFRYLFSCSVAPHDPTTLPPVTLLRCPLWVNGCTKSSRR